MLTIELSNLQFHSFHGVHEEESVTGSDYEVDVQVLVQPLPPVVTNLRDTVDYTVLYGLVKQRMDKPTPLLETVAMETARAILNADAKILEVMVKIKKLNAPIPFFNGNVSAAFTLQRSAQ